VRLTLEHPHIEPQQLEKISVPTLVISGEQDVIKDEHSQLITESLANARRVVIAGASHFVMKDAPAEFDRVVLEFLMEDD
jgi:pimeloyl-ACP methyl ester carboxylesterase